MVRRRGRAEEEGLGARGEALVRGDGEGMAQGVDDDARLGAALRCRLALLVAQAQSESRASEWQDRWEPAGERAERVQTGQAGSRPEHAGSGGVTGSW